MEGRRERVARNTTAGDETRRPKRAQARVDAPAAGREAAAMLRSSARRVVIAKCDDSESVMVVVMNVVEDVVVVVFVVERKERRREGNGPVKKACESERAGSLPFELDGWLCTLC